MSEFFATRIWWPEAAGKSMRSNSAHPRVSPPTTVLPVAFAILSLASASAQPDPLSELNNKILVSSGNVFGFTFEERTRWEQKAGVNFGRSVDQQDMQS